MSASPPPAPERDALWGRVEAAIARERGPRSWLRSRPTPLRVALAALTLLLVGALVVAVAPRPDLGAGGAPRLLWAVEGALLAAGVLAAAILLLRPLGRPEPPRALVTVLAGAGLLLPALLVLLVAGGGEGRGGVLGPALACFALGLTLALPPVLLLVLLARRDRPGAGHGLLLAAAGGLAGNLGLLLHCPRTGLAHLLLGHATVPLGVLGLVALLALAAARRGRRARGARGQGEAPSSR